MSLPHSLNAYDPRTGRLLRSTDKLVVELGPVEPVLLALSEEAVAQSPMFLPRKTRLRVNAEILVRSDASPRSMW